MTDKENNWDLQNKNNMDSEQLGKDKTASCIDVKIELARKHFYGVLMNKKRQIRRGYLEMNAITNEHLLETLSYRTMLQPQTMESMEHVPSMKLKENHPNIDDKTSMSSTYQSCNICDSPSIDEEGIIPQIDEDDGWLDSETDLEIQRILNEATTS